MANRSSARQLVAIMFTDMVGYAALVQRDEALALQLVQRQRAIVRGLLPAFGGREVEVIGDAFLIEFRSALRAAECAIALQQQINAVSADAPEAERFSIRVGLHLGDIERPGKGVFGDSVNIAARVQAQAPHGGIAVSGPVYDQIRNKLAAPFRSLGPTPLKNIERPVELFVLDADVIGTLPPPQPESAPRLFLKIPSPKFILLSAAAVTVALLQWLGARSNLLHEARAGTPSVAVLPFENLSDDKQNEYFVSGMHDSIITYLARVKGLKIISRTSVMEYRDQTHNVKEIGKALGVANIVEGSVQRAGNRVRVTAQLIDAGTDQHLWAETYDRDIADVFAIQSDVAENIVAGVKATLTPELKAVINQRPTADPKAYDLYLRAEELVRQPGNPREALLHGQSLLEQAIALDPGFALAHAALGRIHGLLYWVGGDSTARRRDLALASAQTALRLQPDLPEGHVALGLYFYFALRDYDQALKEFNEALALAPNSSETIARIGYVQRRQGQWDSCIASLSRAVELDPRSSQTARELGLTYAAMHRYSNADASLQKAMMLSESPQTSLDFSFNVFLWKGDLEPLRKALAQIPAGVDPDQVVSLYRIEQARYAGRYAEALALLQVFPRDGIQLGTFNFDVPKDFFIGQMHAALGNRSEARPHLIRARDQLQAYIAQEAGSPHLAQALAWLALTQAYLGERIEATRNADRAAELLPISKDAGDQPQIAQTVAAVHMRLGDHDRALTELAALLKTPGVTHAHALMQNPEWKPLWEDPRFRKMIAENLPKP